MRCRSIMSAATVWASGPGMTDSKDTTAVPTPNRTRSSRSRSPPTRRTGGRSGSRSRSPRGRQPAPYGIFTYAEGPDAAVHGAAAGKNAAFSFDGVPGRLACAYVYAADDSTVLLASATGRMSYMKRLTGERHKQEQWEHGLSHDKREELNALMKKMMIKALGEAKGVDIWLRNRFVPIIPVVSMVMCATCGTRVHASTDPAAVIDPAKWMYGDRKSGWRCVKHADGRPRSVLVLDEDDTPIAFCKTEPRMVSASATASASASAAAAVTEPIAASATGTSATSLPAKVAPPADQKEPKDVLERRLLGVCSKKGCGKQLIEERRGLMYVWNIDSPDPSSRIYWDERNRVYRCAAHATKAMKKKSY